MGRRRGGGHTADTVVGGHERILRQTVITMLKGAVLAEHENPGEVTCTSCADESGCGRGPVLGGVAW